MNDKTHSEHNESGHPPTAAEKRTSKKRRSGPTHKVAALQPAARGQEPRGRSPVERTAIAGGEPRPENRGVVNLTQNGAPHERDQHRQSAASAYDRRYGCAQAQPAHAAQPHLQLQAVCRRLKRSPDTATPD